MEIVNFCDIKRIKPNIDTLCLGSFDGFHLGHQKLISNAVLNSSGKCGVLLFSSHPSCYVGTPIRQLMEIEDKVRFCSKLRLDYVILVQTGYEFFKQSSNDFINNYLVSINPRKIVVGEDYRFGKDAKGTPQDLRKFFEVEVCPLLEKDGVKISSSIIRQLIEDGKIEQANSLLGYNYEISGKVVEGLHNGKKLGFPTANIVLSSNRVRIGSGVYGGIVYSNGIPYKSMINVGVHPTIDKLDMPIIECNLFGYTGNLYAKTLYIEFIKQIRKEKKFVSTDKLCEQLKKDQEIVEELITY